jgi:hypothetical protein
MLMTNLLWISGGYFRTIMLSVTLRDFNPLVMLWKIRQYPFFHKETHNTLTLFSRWDLSLPFTFTVFSCHPSPPRCKRPSTSKPPHLSSLTSSLPPVLDLTQDPIKFNTTRQHRWTRNPVSSLLHQVSHLIPSLILMLVVVNGLDTILIFPSLLCLFNPQFWFPQYQFCKGWIMKYCFDFPNIDFLSGGASKNFFKTWKRFWFRRLVSYFFAR